MQFLYRILADAIVIVHAGYALFVVAGLVLTLIGIARRWQWVRNFWFRLVHLAMIGVVVAEVWCEITCPLTTWEKNLRRLAGQESYQGDFIANWVHEALFFESPPTWVFPVIYTLFGLSVLATFIFAPPCVPFRNKSR
jgi:hypothetical protein